MRTPTLDVLRVRDPENVTDRERHTVWALVAVTLADRIVTVPNWSLEANPLTTALGPSVWLSFTVIALAGMVSIWYATEAYRVRVAHWVVGIMTLFTGVVVMANVAVLFG